MFRRKGIKIIAVMFVFITIVACGSSKPEIEELLKNSIKALKDVETVQTDAKFDVDIAISYKDGKKSKTEDVLLNVDLSTAYTKKPKIMHVEGTVEKKDSSDSSSEKVKGESYYVEEKGEIFEYNYDSDDKEWSKKSSDREVEFEKSTKKIIKSLQDEKKNLKFKNDVKINGKKAYQIEGNIDEEIFESVMSSLVMDSDMKEDVFGSIGFQGNKVKVKVAFYKETNELAKIEVDMKEAFEKVFDKQTKGDKTLKNASIDISKFKLATTYKNYNNKEKIKLPKEFKDLDSDDYDSDFKDVDGVENPKGPWTSLSFVLDGVEHKLPVEYSVLKDSGWIIDSNSEADSVIKPKEVKYVITLKKGDLEIEADFYNPTDQDKKMAEVQVVKVRIVDYSAKDMDFKAPGDLKIGMSEKELNDIYPEFKRKSESKYSIIYYYENDELSYMSSVVISIDPETNKISSIEIDATPEDLEFY